MATAVAYIPDIYHNELVQIIVTPNDSTRWKIELYNSNGLAKLETITNWTESTSIAWVPSDDTILSYLDGKTSEEFILRCYDYGNNTYNDYHFNIYWNSVSSGAITATIWDSNSTTYALTGNSSKFIKYFSTVAFEIYYQTGSPYSHSIDYNVIYGSRNREISTSVSSTNYKVSGNFPNADAYNISFTAKLQGYNPSKMSKRLDVIEYRKLTSNVILSSIDMDGRATGTIYGNFFNGSFGKKSNSLKTLTCVYADNKNFSGAKSVSVSPSKAIISNGTYTLEFSVSGLDPNKTYYFRATASDELMSVTSDSNSANMTTGTPTFDWSETDFNFNVPVNINSDLVVNGSIVSETGAGVVMPKTGSWTPTVNFNYLGTGVYDDAKLSGSYLVVGNICIVSFYINVVPNGQPNGGFSPAYIAIGGLPFQPKEGLLWQSGGGNVTNYTTYNDGSFCGWNIEYYDDADSGYMGFTPTGYYIYGRTSPNEHSKWQGVSVPSSTQVKKVSDYIGIGEYGYVNFPIIMSGTIMYEIAEV